MNIIETKRLILRLWRKEDAKAYFAINQDPNVIEFLLGPLTMEQVNTFINDMNQRFIDHGYTFWAVEEKATKTLIGFIGFQSPSWQAPFTPCIEIGWRLGSQYWGKGYATEGALAALDYGFNKLSFKEIYSFTVPANIRSIKVMEKIGMLRVVDGDFAHPRLPADHKLSHHILYKIERSK